MWVAGLKTPDRKGTKNEDPMDKERGRGRLGPVALWPGLVVSPLIGEYSFQEQRNRRDGDSGGIGRP